MKSRISALLLLLALLVGGCAKQTPDVPAPAEAPAASGTEPETPAETAETAPSAGSEETPDLEAVREAMVDKIGADDHLPLDAAAFENLYGIDPSTLEQGAGFVTMAGVFPDEVVLLEAVDESAAAAAAEKLQTRLDEVMVQAETYDPDSYEKAKACEVVTDGRFVRLLLSPKQDELAEVYKQYIA